MTLPRLTDDPSKAHYASMLRKARQESLSADAEARILANIMAPSAAIAKPATPSLRGLLTKGLLGASVLALVTGFVISSEKLRQEPNAGAPALATAPVTPSVTSGGTSVVVPEQPSSPREEGTVSVHDLPAAPLRDLPARALAPSNGAPPSASLDALDDADSLRAEAALLRSVREDIASGRGAGALEKLDRYDARFGGKGVMREEASVERVEALLQTGAVAEGRALGIRLLEQDPEGPFARKLRSLLAASSPKTDR